LSRHETIFGVKIAILLYEGFTALDAIGPYEVLRSVPGWEVEFVARQPGEVRTDSGVVGLTADRSLAEVGEPEILLVPGGKGSRPAMGDEEILAWLRRVDESTKWTTSVCTGSLLLGAAGLLEGRQATGHWAWLEPLSELGADPVGGRYVEDGKVITAAGVSAGIDMALYLVGREAGTDVAQAIQLGIEYDPDPPFDAGSPGKAPERIVELLREVALSDPNLQIDLPEAAPS
jgi:transcriptional regulator GlxA family with amidase domain